MNPLLEELATLRAEKKTIDAKILGIENALIASTDKVYEGVQHAKGFDVTFKVNRKIDWGAYDTIATDLPEGLQCKTMKPALNLKAFRALEAADPALAAVFCTETPGKPAVKILEEK